jgi:hypothetical protein
MCQRPLRCLVLLAFGFGAFCASVPAPADVSSPVVIEAETVDAQGKPLTGVNLALLLYYSSSRNRAEPPIQETLSDAQGRARLRVNPLPSGEQAETAILWAYMPGHALTISTRIVFAEKSPPAPVRLVMGDPVKQTITIVRPAGQPRSDLHLVPRTLRTARPSVFSVPEAWAKKLTVISDASGVATIPYLPRVLSPLTVRVSGTGLARHTLQVTEQASNEGGSVDLKGTGKLAGIVRTESGEPLRDVAVEVWVRAAGTRPAGVGLARGRQRATPTEAVQFDARPLRTTPDGAFETPRALLNGSTYRVSLRHNGFAPFVSGWITLDGDRATVSPIRMRQLRTLTGSVRDRSGQPVAGARVFLPSGGPSTPTDAQGHFELTGIVPEKTVLLVEHPGFRPSGWPVEPTAVVEPLALKLARSSEPADHPIAPLPDALSDAEMRAIAKQLFEPFLRAAVEKGSDIQQLVPLDALIEIDPDRVREMLDKGLVQSRATLATLRGGLAVPTAPIDPADAEALVEAIDDPRARASFQVQLAAALPKSESARKRALLERAAVQARAIPQVPMKLNLLANIMKTSLDLGMVELASPLSVEGLKILDSQGTARAGLPAAFLAQFARIHPEEAIKRIAQVKDTSVRDHCFALAAFQLAQSHAAQAEQCLGLVSERRGIVPHTSAMLICRRMARVDLPRARKIADALKAPGERACAWAFIALGVSDVDTQAAQQALDRSIEQIDRLREPGTPLGPATILDGIRTLYATNPAAVVLPVIELVAPGRLAEFFWRAVALHERTGVDQEDALLQSAIGYECMLLSHYDRQVAAVLFDPMDQFIKSVVAEKRQSDELNSSVLIAKACLDPKAAVELLDTLPVARKAAMADASNEARVYLARAFVLPSAARWNRLWGLLSAQLPLDNR